MCDQDCVCVSCTVTFGQQLANLFQIWIDITSKADEHLDQVLYDIEVSTSALSQLSVFLEQDKVSSTQVFTPAGHQEIESLVIKCNLIFKAVILIVQKAADKKSLDSDDGVRKGWGFFGIPDKSKQNRIKIEESAQDEKTDEKSELLIGPVPSLTSPKTLGLVARLRGKWDWLSNRVTHCQIQLRWIRKSLLLHVQMGRLTLVGNQGSTNDNGSFESQVVIRAAIILMWKSQQRFITYRADRQRRAEKRAQRRLEAQKETDTASLHSASSQGTASTVVVDEPPMIKSPVEILAPSPVAIPPVVITNGPADPIRSTVQSAGQPNPQVPTKLDIAGDVNLKEKVSTKLSASFNELSLKVSETMSEWTHRIFGKEDEFSKDWESQELEAWVFRANTPYSDPIKVPFGHQRLQHGLKKIKSKRSTPLALTTFARYIDGGPRVQVCITSGHPSDIKLTHNRLVNEVVREANRLQNKEKVCLAFETYRRQDNDSDLFTIVFFSIREEKAPIIFKDCIGRKMTLPFEMCRTWEDMRLHIVEAFIHIPGIGPHVMEGHFSLQDSKKGDHILPGLWSSTIKPGDSIVMLMWPNPNVNHPLRGFYAQPPFGPPPRQVAQNSARQARVSRIQAASSVPPHLRAGMPRPFGPMVGSRPPPMFPPGRTVPPPGVNIIDVRRRRRAASSIRSIDEDEMTEAEEKELTFVNFVEELQRTKDTTTADILAKYTQLYDVSGQECLEEWDVDDSGSDSGSDSDSSRTSSLGSHSTLDD